MHLFGRACYQSARTSGTKLVRCVLSICIVWSNVIRVSGSVYIPSVMDDETFRNAWPGKYHHIHHSNDAFNIHDVEFVTACGRNTLGIGSMTLAND